MDQASVTRVANVPAEEKHAGIAKLPEDTQLVTGTIVGHGATELASINATLSARVVKLARNIAGGIDYQIAIFVNEPAPIAVVEARPAEDPNFIAAVDYFKLKGLSDGDARKQVNQFGVPRVLAARDKDLDQELQAVISKEKSA